MARHHLAGGAGTVERAVRDVVAMHSSDPITPFVGVWARTGLEVPAIEDALYKARGLCRVHGIRRTIWVLPLDTGPTMLGAATIDVAKKERARLVAWIEKDGRKTATRWLSKLEKNVLAALADGEPKSTRDLTEAVPALSTPVTLGSGKWTVQQAVASRLLSLLAMRGIITRGRPLGSWRASQYRWSMSEAWFGQPLEAEPVRAARAELVRAYLERFGPVTLADVRWWTGWSKRDSVKALEDLGAEETEVASGAAWIAPGDDGETEATKHVSLLPSLDPTPMGWKDRAWIYGELAELGGPLFDRNGNVGPTVWIDGHLVGAWAQRPDGEVVTELLVKVKRADQKRVAAHVKKLRVWLGDHVVIPRFRTPLEKALAGR